jgi:hypothetical protein
MMQAGTCNNETSLQRLQGFSVRLWCPLPGVTTPTAQKPGNTNMVVIVPRWPDATGNRDTTRKLNDQCYTDANAMPWLCNCSGNSSDM